MSYYSKNIFYNGKHSKLTFCKSRNALKHFNMSKHTIKKKRSKKKKIKKKKIVRNEKKIVGN